MVSLIREQILTKDDLKVFVQDGNGNLINPFSITYSIYHIISHYSFYNQSCGEELILETLNSVPIPFGIGKFFAPWVMPKDIELGHYRIKWVAQQYADSPMVEEPMEFEIISKVDATAQALLAGGASSDAASLQDLFNGGCAEAS